jgi:hypothetical protein
MLETLSEFDDTLLEQLIEDVAPEKVADLPRPARRVRRRPDRDRC